MDFSLGYLFSSFMIGMIGFGYFRYGKSAARLYPLLAGIAMFIYPFFFTNLLVMWAICIALMVACFFLRDK